MDLGSLPDLAAHFSAAVTHIIPVLQHAADYSGNVWTAITTSDAMPASEKLCQIGKLGISTVGLISSVLTENALGIAGFALADTEAIVALHKAGAEYNALHPPAPPAPPMA